jgi:hypothetical protein
MRALLPFGLALSALTTGCAMSIPETPPYPPSITGADPVPGASFCSRTETAARSLSSAQAAGGWVLASLGIAATGGGAITTLVNVGDGQRIIAGTALTVGGIGIGALGIMLLMRSEASGRLAQASNSAMLERNDHDAWESCVRAKAAWAGAKGSADAISQEMLMEKERENRRLKDELEQAEKRGGKTGEAAPLLGPRR